MLLATEHVSTITISQLFVLFLMLVDLISFGDSSMDTIVDSSVSISPTTKSFNLTLWRKIPLLLNFNNTESQQLLMVSPSSRSPINLNTLNPNSSGVNSKFLFTLLPQDKESYYTAVYRYDHIIVLRVYYYSKVHILKFHNTATSHQKPWISC